MKGIFFVDKEMERKKKKRLAQGHTFSEKKKVAICKIALWFLSFY